MTSCLVVLPSSCFEYNLWQRASISALELDPPVYFEHEVYVEELVDRSLDYL